MNGEAERGDFDRMNRMKERVTGWRGYGFFHPVNPVHPVKKFCSEILAGKDGVGGECVERYEYPI
jgi:hypothetical protein